MKKFIIDIDNLSQVCLYTNINKISEKLLKNPESLTKTIPAEIKYCGDVDKIEEDNNCIVIADSNNKGIDVSVEDNTAYLFCPAEEFFFPDFVYLALGMFSNDLQKKDCYFVQGATLKYDSEHSIMLIGDPNAGKTTMAYSLMKNNNYRLISNDNVLVSLDGDKLKTHLGTTSVQMRYAGIKLYFPEIVPYVEVPEEDKVRNEWNVKLYIDDYLKANNYQYASNSIVTDIYNISTFKSGDTYIRGRERIDEILLIYEHLTKQIRSTRYALTGFNYPLPSFEKEEYRQKRYDMAEQICKSTNIYDARGTIDELSKRLVKK